MRNNKSRGTLLSADYELSGDLLDLAVRVFCQTLTAEHEDLINITQMVQLDTTQVRVIYLCKKKKKIQSTFFLSVVERGR